MALKKRDFLLFGALALASAAVVLTSRAALLDEPTFARVIASRPAIGDIIFTRIGGPIFSRVAATTHSWTSHVGIIVDYQRGDWIVAESGIPVVRKTPLRKFLGHSEGAQFAICRLRTEPTAAEKVALRRFADAQMGKWYSLGFNLESQNTFCSKFVHDAVNESTHQSLGEVETFDHLLHRNPQAPLGFWRAWFFGSIPWQRTTITPASELNSPLLRVVVQHNV
jgi:permuted papain-like amidase YaeF/Yiix C92 family enzyme